MKKTAKLIVLAGTLALVMAFATSCKSSKEAAEADEAATTETVEREPVYDPK
ncbi:MAG: hypothetical protein IJP62_05190 [Treponema sp.]|nr:hypothetical protein [Treponema sp.]